MRPYARRKTTPQLVVVAALLALLVHGLVLLLLVGSGALQTLPLGRTVVAERTEGLLRLDEPPIEIEWLVDQLDRPQQETPEEQRRRQEEETTRPEGQVVDIARPALEQRPDQARFLAEYDSTVERETRGPPGRSQAGALQPAARPTPPPRPARPGRAGPPGPLALRSASSPPAAESSQDLAPDGTARWQPGGPHRTPSQPGGGQPAAPATPNLLATPELLERVLGQGAGSPDYLKDIDDGEYTALNAKRWKFASFFNRLKQAVADEWHPDTVYLRHDPSGNIYGIKDRITVLRVHLKPDGRIAAIQILRPSGVEFLDDEAVGAFKRAQPFPNPPQQLVEPDGLIRFNFAFIFELSGRTSFKVFRY
ncbi:MAG: energy transducer TonB [Myxococcales bacterium]|nr:TonB C-terminal domain-containing protein [Myxococcota bacterium]MDW8282006.1 energy transducer TonB [Myxococcales bacterium]